MAKKIVVNKCFGGFGLSMEAIEEYAKKKGLRVFFYVQTKYSFRDGADKFTLVTKDDKSNQCIYSLTENLGPTCSEKEINAAGWLHDTHIPRDDADLIAVVEELGDRANGSHAELFIVEIPDDVNWKIDEYDGMEHVAERHRTW